MVVTSQRHEALCQADEANAERALVDYALDGVLWLQLLTSVPKGRHEKWELLGASHLLEVETLVKLEGCDVQYLVKTLEEVGYALLLIDEAHALDGNADNIDCRKRQVAATY